MKDVTWIICQCVLISSQTSVLQLPCRAHFKLKWYVQDARLGVPGGTIGHVIS